MARKVILGLMIAFLTVSLSCRTPQGATVSDKRDYVHRMKDDTLSKLYAKKPAAKGEIERAAGYGVFSNLGTKIFLLSSGRGFGMVVDNSSGKKTYMKMMEVGVGFGLGVKDFRAIFVFHDKEVLRRFVEEGWEFGGEADAAAKSGDTGLAESQAQSVGAGGSGLSIYQITEAGIALSATVSGTKYWKDDDLN